MKSLKERQEARAAHRELEGKGKEPLSSYGVDGKLIGKASSEGTGNSNETVDPLDSMTIAQLKEWVAAQDQANPVTVPDNIKLLAEVREYAKNYRSSLAASQQNWTN